MAYFWVCMMELHKKHVCLESTGMTRHIGIYTCHRASLFRRLAENDKSKHQLHQYVPEVMPTCQLILLPIHLSVYSLPIHLFSIHPCLPVASSSPTTYPTQLINWSIESIYYQTNFSCICSHYQSNNLTLPPILLSVL